jgi:hypothetical protein
MVRDDILIFRREAAEQQVALDLWQLPSGDGSWFGHAILTPVMLNLFQHP